MKHFSHVNTAATIIRQYSAQQPFHLFIKDFFRQHKKYGSKDRKQVTHLCFCYFRLGPTAKNMVAEDAIVQALFLCSHVPGEILAALQPDWNHHVTASVEEKCTLLNTTPAALKIFPFPGQLSPGIDAAVFDQSHLIQPDVFLRIRPGYANVVIEKMEKAGIAYRLLQANCISLPAGTKVDELLQVNKEVVVQDYSSQRTGEWLQLVPASQSGFSVWDCCAASGGKSIMAKDTLGDIDLTVSDIRPAILANLKKRFEEAGIRNYKMQTADLSHRGKNKLPGLFSLIIADVPCTGSGTWGRTPERLSFFEEKEIDSYSQLQKKIVTSAMHALQSGGYFLYITCSVFKKENEDMAHFIETSFAVEIVKMEIIKGYAQKADTMFAALFRKRI